MTVEIISRSISMKVWHQAGMRPETPGSAVRLATDCPTGLTQVFILYAAIAFFPSRYLNDLL